MCLIWGNCALRLEHFYADDVCMSTLVVGSKRNGISIVLTRLEYFYFYSETNTLLGRYNARARDNFLRTILDV